MQGSDEVVGGDALGDERGSKRNEREGKESRILENIECLKRRLLCLFCLAVEVVRRDALAEVRRQRPVSIGDRWEGGGKEWEGGKNE